MIMFLFNILVAPPPKATKRQMSTSSNGIMSTNGNGVSHNGNDLFGSAPFAATNNIINPAFNVQNQNVINSATPNYNLSDFNTQTCIFPPNGATNGASFTNGTNGLVGFDPFDTAKFNNIADSFGSAPNGFSNPIGNGFNGNGMSNGFGHTSPFGDKQNTASLDNSFSGFLDKRISEMKV